MVIKFLFKRKTIEIKIKRRVFCDQVYLYLDQNDKVAKVLKKPKYIGNRYHCMRCVKLWSGEVPVIKNNKLQDVTYMAVFEVKEQVRQKVGVA